MTISGIVFLAIVTGSMIGFVWSEELSKDSQADDEMEPRLVMTEIGPEFVYPSEVSESLISRMLGLVIILWTSVSSHFIFMAAAVSLGFFTRRSTTSLGLGFVIAASTTLVWLYVRSDSRRSLFSSKDR